MAIGVVVSEEAGIRGCLAPLTGRPEGVVAAPRAA